MRKTSLLFIITFCLSFFATQQSYGQAAILALLFGDKVASENFNISLELGSTYMGYSNLENSKSSKLGLNFGIAGNIKIADNWFVSPSAYFLARRNAQFSSLSLDSGNPSLDANFQNVNTSIDLNYIDVPIFISYQTNNKKFRYSVGPQVSFLNSSNATFKGAEGKFVQDVGGSTGSLDYGAIADFAYILGKAHKGRGIHLHLRYYYGMTDVFTDEISSGYNRNSFVSLHLSLPFITDALAKKNLEELD
ncbi:PorT family protein [Flammeovirga pectinis]|uniref:PorT family protein n=1 Tax=Flammeovirga pectinis TaxID=2494373 RepID=A0A3S9P9H6_9BACT|nr:porin family protein [Flammeovirga pectinis]AZQ64868.1 PorT family protein [Flammeovirga pectinis]